MTQLPTKPLLAATLGLVLAMTAAQAAPFAPARDDEVVERLPARSSPEQRARRAALARDPLQLPLALATARESIERARREGDPRELGAAQAVLAPWWHEPQPPAAVRLLRATILQGRHAFDDALRDLDGVVGAAATPAALRAQALLTRASLHQLRGRFDAARADCEALQTPVFAALGDAVRVAAAACTIELRSLLADPRRARDDLDALAATSTPDPWLALLRAEAAERLGDDRAAQQHFEAAGEGVYARGAHADWLLDRGREREVIALLDRGPSAADALLLRRAIAWHRLGDPRAAEAVGDLRARFAAVRLRGDSPHLREEARLALDIDRDPSRALALAREQWSLQQEPADAVLLWRAARAAGPREAAQAARALRDWLPDPARADVRLAGLPLTPGSLP